MDDHRKPPMSGASPTKKIKLSADTSVLSLRAFHTHPRDPITLHPIIDTIINLEYNSRINHTEAARGSQPRVRHTGVSGRRRGGGYVWAMLMRQMEKLDLILQLVSHRSTVHRRHVARNSDCGDQQRTHSAPGGRKSRPRCKTHAQWSGRFIARKPGRCGQSSLGSILGYELIVCMRNKRTKTLFYNSTPQKTRNRRGKQEPSAVYHSSVLCFIRHSNR